MHDFLVKFIEYIVPLTELLGVVVVTWAQPGKPAAARQHRDYPHRDGLFLTKEIEKRVAG